MADFLSIDGLHKVYQSGRKPITALQDVHLGVARGEFVSIVGPSGCGKSTLMRCIAGLEPITSGRLALDGVPITEPPDNMGVVFQRDLLLEWRSILDNVLAAAEFHGLERARHAPRARELLALFGLADFMDRYPRELSGGMRQRVSICRALLLDPQLLLMDEPFGALDALTRASLQDELNGVMEKTGATVVMVTHDVDEAVLLSDRIVMMTNGPAATIGEILDVKLARPRDRLKLAHDADFVEYRAALLEFLYQKQVKKAA